MRDFDRERLETLYAAKDVHFVLRGHLHRNRTEAARTPDGLVVELAAGATYPGGGYEKTYLLTEANFARDFAIEDSEGLRASALELFQQISQIRHRRTKPSLDDLSQPEIGICQGPKVTIDSSNQAAESS